MAGSIARLSIWWLALLAAIGTGIAAGVFFAFSNFIMKGLGLIPADQGIAAMQAINVTVITPLFMTVLFGTAGICVPLLFFGFRALRHPGAYFLVAACLIYIFGTIVVTAACNVPLNNQLAAIHSGDAAGLAVWAKYLRDWTIWNHVRTLSSLLACALFVVALGRLGRTN